ncbi:hypothetical protein EBZ35_05945 [bacterium]|nr:hypothetical protein [bacterium]
MILDGTSLVDSDGFDSNAAHNLRRIRTELNGRVNPNTTYRVNVEYSEGTVRLLDGHVDLALGKQWSLRAGKFKFPLGLELLQTPTNLVQTEFGITTLLVPNRDNGVQLSGQFDWGSVQLAVMDVGQCGECGRVGPFVDATRRAVYQRIEQRTGGTMGRIQPRYRPNILEYATGATPDGTFSRLAPQFYWMAGPWGIMGESVISDQTLRVGGVTSGLRHIGTQVSLQYYLTGESASYGTVNPLVPFVPEADQWGAWQLTARWQSATFDESAASRGLVLSRSSQTYQSASLGVNWVWNESVKWLLTAETVQSNSYANIKKDITFIDLRLQVKY